MKRTLGFLDSPHFKLLPEDKGAKGLLRHPPVK